MSTRIREANYIQENKLRSYLDGELTASESETTASHLASCGACASKLETLRSDAAAVDSLFASLAPEQPLPTAAPELLPFAYQRRAARFGLTAALSLGALAAAIIAAILLLNHRATSQAPSIGKQQPAQTAPLSVVPDQNNHTVLPAQAKQPSLPLQATHKNVSFRPANHVQPQLHFIRLDNDGPIESGLIYRVKLPGTIFSSLDPTVLSSQVSADVIVDSSGRPRAIRFLSSQIKSTRLGE
ncbi:MAG: zf-HC2 domain-containing protein [Candidatus Acidiferrales bacterium]